MATRTATATGTIINDGNVASDFRVNLWLQVTDAIGSQVIGYPRVAQSATASLAGGQSSASITLTGTAYLEGNWTAEAWVTLDRTAPSPKNAIASTGRTSYKETIVYGGTITGFGPTLFQRFQLRASRRLRRRARAA